MKPLASLLLFTLLAGCAALKPHPDPAAAARHAALGARLVVKHRYAEAAKEYAQAQQLDPAKAAYALELGDLREALEEYRSARRAYRDGLDAVAPGDPQRPDLVWRLALLEALHLDAAEAAQKLAGQLAGNDFRALDLDGVLRLGPGRTWATPCNASPRPRHGPAILPWRPSPSITPPSPPGVSTTPRKPSGPCSRPSTRGLPPAWSRTSNATSR